MTNPSDERAVAVRIANDASEQDREAMLVWMVNLLQIRDSKALALVKVKNAVLLTARSRVVWPIAKMIATELKRIGWDDRGTKSRAALATAAATLALVGGQGAGIAALGTAIGLPLWIVLGAGAYFATGMAEELFEKLPPDVQDRMRTQIAKVKDLEDRIKRRGEP